MPYRVEVTTLVEATCDRCGAVREVVIPDHTFWNAARARLRKLGWRALPSNNGRSVLCPDCKATLEGDDDD